MRRTTGVYLTLSPPDPIILALSFAYFQHIKYELFHMIKIKRDINQQHFKIAYLYFFQIWIIFVH